MKIVTTFGKVWTLRLLGILGMGAGLVQAEVIHIAQSAQGANTGADPTTAHAASWFNTAANWGTGAGKISPGDTVVLDGVIQTPLQIQASGTAGSPITIQWAIGARMSKPHWNQGGSFANAAIFASGRSYIVLDGQTDPAGDPQGIIEATDNGTALGNQQFNHGIYFDGTSHDCVMKNLQISNLFVRTSGSASVAEDGIRGIRIYDSAGHNLITNNIVVNVCHGIVVNHVGSPDSDEIAYNTVEKRDAGILYTSSASGISTNVRIHDNAIGDAVQWDDASDNFHHDGLHLYSGGASGHPDGLYYYNNYHYGDRGIHSTADVFLEDYWQHVYVYNNVFSNKVSTAGHTPSNGHITMKGRGIAQNSVTANNTLVLVGAGGHALYLDSSTGNSIVNNIVIGDASKPTTGCLLASAGDTANTVNWNIYYNVSQWFYNNSVKSSYSTWQSATAADSNSRLGNPNLDSGLRPQTGSIALGAGTALRSIFTVDRAGQIRPASWSVGAYELPSTTIVAPPTNLRIVAQ